MSFRPEFKNLRAHRGWNLFLLRNKTLPACFELIQIATQQFDPVLGMNTGGSAITARNLFLSYLSNYLSADMNHLTGGFPSATTRISASQPRSIWSGLGTITTDSAFNFAYTANTANSASYPGRFNTTLPSAGQWLDSDSSLNFTLSSARNAFCCYITDLGDFLASLTFEFYLGVTLIKSVAVPYQDFNTGEVMHFGYLNGAISFDKVRIAIEQPGSPSLDSVGYDDLVIGTALPCV
jgi:hypothetical protein